MFIIARKNRYAIAIINTIIYWAIVGYFYVEFNLILFNCLSSNIEFSYCTFNRFQYFNADHVALQNAISYDG